MKRYLLALFLALAPISAWGQGSDQNIDTGGSPGFPSSSALIPLTNITSAQTINSTDQLNYWGSKISCLWQATSIISNPNIRLIVQGKDVFSGIYYTIGQTEVISANDLTAAVGYRLAIAPGLLASGAASTVMSAVNDFVPLVWRARVVLTNMGDIAIGSVGCSVVR